MTDLVCKVSGDILPTCWWSPKWYEKTHYLGRPYWHREAKLLFRWTSNLAHLPLVTRWPVLCPHWNGCSQCLWDTGMYS